jgi:hypothetical protein
MHGAVVVADGGVDVGAALQNADVAGVVRLGRVAVCDGVHVAAHGVQRGRAIAVQDGLQLRLIWLRQHQRSCVRLHRLAVPPTLEVRVAGLAPPSRNSMSATLTNS